jgi:hypothetical protein
MQFELFGLDPDGRDRLGLLAFGPWTLGTDLGIFETVDVDMHVYDENALDRVLEDARRLRFEENWWA